MKIGLLLIADDEVERDRCIESAKLHLPELDDLVEIDDRPHTLGFAGAIQEGWKRIRMMDWDYVFHLEGDFLFNRVVPIPAMVNVLADKPYLVQMALKRQPISARELQHGTVVPQDADQRVGYGNIWLEHRAWFTTNPCIYPAALCNQDWPKPPDSERVFSDRLFDGSTEARAGIWGARHDDPAVTHIGTRNGWGY